MSKPIIMLTAAAIIFAGVGITSAALGQHDDENATGCNTYKDALEYLEKHYSEKPIARGLSSDNKVMVELTSSEDGSWTILVTDTFGISCVLAAGRDWHDLKVIPVKSGSGI